MRLSTLLRLVAMGEFLAVSLFNLLDKKTDRLRELDIQLMKRISTRVNVIPVISKADSLAPTELQEFKKRVFEPNVVCL
jgi:septin family protein